MSTSESRREDQKRPPEDGGDAGSKSIIVACPDCRARLQVNPRAKQTVGKCPRCDCGIDFAEAIRHGGPAYIVGEPLPGQEVGGYRIDKLLGRGGMGAVFQAAHPFSGQKIAVKVLRQSYSDEPTFRARFQREIEALKALDHPHIVEILGSGEADGVHYFTMTLVNGISLRDVMKQQRLNLKERLQIIEEVCSALQHAHDSGVVHRDLKPQNVLIDEARHAQVVDFGIARLTRGNVLSLTRTGQIIGTSRYMAPEQQRDAKHVDCRADVYSIGVMAYELLTGQLPVGSFAPLSQLNPGLPPEVDPVIERALEVQPEDRYAGPGSFWQEFGDALKGRPRSVRRRLRLAAAVAAAAVVAALLWLWATSVHSGDPERPGPDRPAPLGNKR